MANIFFPSGEIFEPLCFLNEQAATELGKRVLAVSHPYNLQHPSTSGNSMNISAEIVEGGAMLARDGSNFISLTSADKCIVDKVKEDFSTLIGEGWNFNSDFFLGAPAGGRWHIDASHDVRAIINLSNFPLKLSVATSWDRKDYATARSKYDDFAHLMFVTDKKKKPYKTKTIVSNPGFGVIINNMARADRQIPHQATNPTGKAILRLFATKK